MKLVLIDGHAILHRAFHALPPLTTTKGIPIGAVYGFTSMLIKTINDLKPTNLAVVFDLPEPTFRKKLFPDYQGKRPKMEESLVSQVELTHDLIKKLGIAVYELSGYEADDVIGTITQAALKGAREGKGEVSEVIIVTGDRDMLQLVDDRIRLYMPVKGISETKLYGRQDVKEKFGINPERFIEYKALIGDPSDNYPGVSGIGPKGAVNLIEKYGTVEKIYGNLDQIEGKIREKLISDKEKAFLSKKLATIVVDAPVDFDLSKTKLINLDRPEVRHVFEEMEFRSLIPRLGPNSKFKDTNKFQNSNVKSQNQLSKSKSEQTLLF